MFRQLTIYFLIIPLIEGNVYLYNTHDNLSVEFYDCITDNNLPYCRRPSEPILLQRDQPIWHCDHDGIPHSFSLLFMKNVSVTTLLHQWSSSIEKAEEYARYKKQRQSNQAVSGDEKYLCECINPQSFGKHCEYLLPMGNTFRETINWEIEMKTNNIWDMHRYSDIVCYTTLICNSGLLCLDWRDICDGTQHCMYGYDEENCDLLEFNECEDHEYRCVNGMCIPDQYFLDGEHDCADLTDEKNIYNDTKCTFQPASYECDDRMCKRSHWSCGDGQCIWNRVYFQIDLYSFGCNSLRDQYHMCETHRGRPKWTLPNGKCYEPPDYVEIVENNRTDLEKCLYFIKCALSQGGEKNCPCKRNVSCIDKWRNPCSSYLIQYPNGAIVAPYVFSFYTAVPDRSQWMTPDRIVMNGSLKCRGYMIKQSTRLESTSPFDYILRLEVTFCASKSNISMLLGTGYDEFCHNDSRTFNNHSYHFIDVCNESKECISAYRINDGFKDCAYDEDEEVSSQFPNTCSKIQRYRFRCSSEEPTCLLVNYMGDEFAHCRNARDEWWMNGGTKLSKLICNSQSKDDCGRVRQYIEESWNLDINNSSDQQLQLPKIPFRSFCDTFWNWGSREDENIEMCHKWWRCSENQWQCRSGQCIEIEWVLDGEWDCVDASDEQGIFVPSNNFSLRNLNLINNEQLREKFITLYNNQSFWKLCNLSMEYPCFRVNVSDPLNIKLNRPCISLHQIGDGHVNCAGGLDERNNLKHCSLSTMLGNYFQCSSADCTSYSYHCPFKCDDNHVSCYGYGQAVGCFEESDFMCLDGQCAKNGWCNQHFDCSHGEDELLCVKRIGSIDISPFDLYRENKELSVRTTKHKLQLPQLPINNHGKKMTDITISMLHNGIPVTNFFDKINPIISYSCNRGIGVQLQNESIICFCPPQYYGDRCQFHSDRILFFFHLNLSQSIYAESNNPKTILKLLVIFMHNNQPLMTESFQTTVIYELVIPWKKFVHLFYSRSNSSLNDKRSRYFNRSNIINEHPYSIRIEAYELNPYEKVRLVGVWLYPIYFDFLPSFRLVKVLHLTKSDPINNPCSSNPCNSQEECHQILNDNSTYVCLCRPNFKGGNCSLIDDMCKRGFCSSDALCKPNYRGTLNGNEHPYCICPLNEIGHQCELIHDSCDLNPCRNNGTCLSTLEVNRFTCLCDEYHYGDQCQLEKRGVQLEIKNTPSHLAVVVQYFDINFVTLDFLLVNQHIYANLPDLVHYQHVGNTAPSIIVVKFYSGSETDIYLISIQIDVESINGITELNETNRCVHVETLFPTDEEISPFKYHNLCVENLDLLCFIDQSYLCICDENHNRSECFGYDHNLDQCSSCLSGGKCLTENRSESNFVCLCPQCHNGKSCEFSSEYFSFTFDSLLIQISPGSRLMYFVFVILCFVIGGLANYASIITFKRPNLRKTSMGIYMLILSLISQYSLFSVVMKIILILFNSLMNDLSCRIVSYMHSISIRCSFWIISWIAIERVSYLLFPYSTVLKKRRIAIIISLNILLIVGIMHVHELIFYRTINDQNNQSSCIVDYSSTARIYNRISVLINYLIPFSIQILSITILIILAACQRSRMGNNRDTYKEYLKRQFQRQKDLYIPPIIIILSSLPQIILSFSFACNELVEWQQHALLVTYFLSLAPQLLGFILFIFPSTNYMKEFEATKLSKTIFFRWIISKKKNQRKIIVS